MFMSRCSARFACALFVVSVVIAAASPVAQRADAAADIGAWVSVPPMAVARVDQAAARLGDGHVLVAGGYDGNPFGTYENSAEVFDPTTNTWSSTDPLPIGVSHASAVTLADGNVLVTGGYASSEDPPADIYQNVALAEVYDEVSGHWTAVQPMLAHRSFHSSVLLADGRVLVAGGQTPSSGQPN